MSISCLGTTQRDLCTCTHLTFPLAYTSSEDQPWEREKCPFREGEAKMKVTVVKAKVD